MPRYLHNHFLESRAEFASVMDYWKTVCADALQKAGSQDQWEPFIGDHKAGNLPTIQEGPIWSLYNQHLNRAFVIEQYPVESSEPAMAANIDNFGQSYLPESIKVLTISCELSEETAKIAQLLICLWADPSISPEEMNRKIELMNLKFR